MNMGGETDNNESWSGQGDPRYQVGEPCLIRIMNGMLIGGASGTIAGGSHAAWLQGALFRPYKKPITQSPSQVLKEFRGASFEQTEARILIRAMLRPILWFTAVSTSYALGSCLSESVRSKQDAVNAGVGGALAGMVMGSASRRFDILTASAMGMGLFMFCVDYSGPTSANDPTYVRHMLYDMLPQSHEDSSELRALKDKYPQFKDN